MPSSFRTWVRTGFKQSAGMTGSEIASVEERMLLGVPGKRKQRVETLGQPPGLETRVHRVLYRHMNYQQ